MAMSERALRPALLGGVIEEGERYRFWIDQNMSRFPGFIDGHPGEPTMDGWVSVETDKGPQVLNLVHVWRIEPLP